MNNDIPPWHADLDPPRYVLRAGRLSAAAELVRWTFELHHLPYAERAAAWFRTTSDAGARSPTVVHAAGSWHGTHDILHGINHRLRAGETLFGDDDETRARRIALLDQLLNRLLNPSSANVAHVFDMVEAELGRRGSRFLGGATPDITDIAFAALTAPLTQPTGAQPRIPKLTDLAQALQQFAETQRGSRAWQLALDVYAVARTVPQPRLTRPRRSQTLTQRLLGPTVQRLGARLAARIGSPLVFGGFALISRYEDVQRVLEHDLPFRIAPINGPNFDAISGPFVLGLDRSAQFAHERRAMYESVARINITDLRTRIAAEAARLLDRAVETDGRIDVAHGYAHLVAARTASHLFGIRGPTESDLMRVCRALFHFSFLADPDDEAVTSRARRAAAELRTWMTQEIERRRREHVDIDDVLGRLLALRDASGTVIDADTVRRILVGLLVGAIDTTGPTVPRIICMLASEPGRLARVERDVHDRDRMLGWCSEALRMWSAAPVLFRRAPHTTMIGGRTIPAGCKVAAFTQAAMFDRGVFPNPTALEPTRPQRHYINFGGGLHPCAGRGVNDVQLPDLVTPLIARGIASVGRPRFVGPFIDELVVTFRRQPS